MILFKKNSNHYKKYLSTAYIFCFVGMAFHVSVLGPTLPALAQIYGQTEVTGLSLALIGKSIGGFGGVLSMGKVLATYPKHANIIMFFLSVLAGIFTILIPNFSFGAKGPVGVILFSIVLFFQGFFQQDGDLQILGKFFFAIHHHVKKKTNRYDKLEKQHRRENCCEIVTSN